MAWRPDEPLGDVLRRLQEQQTDVLDVQQVGLAELNRLAGVRELFDSMVVVENFPAVDGGDADGLGVRGFTGTDSPHYPVSLVAFPGRALTLEIKYDAAVGAADRPAAGRPGGRLVDQLADGLDRPVCRTVPGRGDRPVARTVAVRRRERSDAGRWTARTRSRSPPGHR